MADTKDILQNQDDTQLVAAGELVELKFVNRDGKAVSGLSLRAGKFLHELINNAGPTLTRPGQRFKIDVARLNIAAHRSATEIESSVQELVGTVVAVDMHIRGKPARRWGPFLSDVVRYDEATNILEYEFSPLVRAIFQVSKHWASLSAQAVYAFESAYALRLYEMITLRENLKHKHEETFTVEELRQRLGVPHKKLSRYFDFKRKALQRAIDEVNYLSGCIVDFQERKRGRKIEKITISWRQKEGPEIDDTAARLDKTRLERSSGRKTAVEQLDRERQQRRNQIMQELTQLSNAEQTEMLE